MFVNSDESICMNDLSSSPTSYKTKKKHPAAAEKRKLHLPNSDNNGIAVISHRYLGDGKPSNTSGGGVDNPALIHDGCS